MNLFCFNSYRDPLFGLSRLVFGGEGEYASDAGAMGGPWGSRPNERRVASAADVQADRPADQPAPGPADESAREAGEAPREGRRRLRGTIDQELEKRLAEFQPAIETLLETPTQALRDFVRSHPVFEVGRDKAAAWNLEFCQKILGKTDAKPRDAQCAVYALQHVLNDLMKRHHNGAEYPFKQERTINAHTRMDGYMGGYTISVLAGYLNKHKPEADKPKLRFTKLEKDRADRTTKYGEAMTRLKGIFGDPEAAAAAGAVPGEGELALTDTELLPEEYKRYLDGYLFALSQRYSEDVYDRVNAGSAEFRAAFQKCIDYIKAQEKDYYTVDLNGWLELFSEMEREGLLTREELQLLYPEDLEGYERTTPVNEFVNYPFEKNNLHDFEKRVNDFYNEGHYRNLWNLQNGHEVDYGVTIVEDFLEQPEYSNAKVRAAYDVYKNAIRDYSTKPLDAKQKAALMTRINKEILPALKKAIDAQKQGALERIRYWEVQGRLPVIKYNNFPLARQNLVHNIPMYLRSRDKEVIFQVLQNPARDQVFGNYQHLLVACHTDQLEALQREFQQKGFLEPARTAEQSTANEKRVVDFFNAVIWTRNINQFRQETNRHFLPPETRVA